MNVRAEREKCTAMMEQQHSQMQLLVKHLERELDEVKAEKENPWKYSVHSYSLQ